MSSAQNMSVLSTQFSKVIRACRKADSDSDSRQRSYEVYAKDKGRKNVKQMQWVGVHGCCSREATRGDETRAMMTSTLPDVFVAYG
jgi:hypothetical protein